MKSTAVDKIIKYVLKATVFVMPFFFLPISTSYVNFNKVALIVFISVLLLVLFALKVFLDRKFPEFFQKKSIDYLVLAFLLGHLLFTMFSSNPLISFFGEYGEWFPSFISSLSLSVIYFAVRAAFRDKDIKDLYVLLSFGIFVGSVLSILLVYLSSIVGSNYMSDSVFGVGREAAVYAIIGALFSVYFILRDDFKDKFKKLQIGIFVANLLVLFLVGSVEGFVVFIAALSGIYLLTSKEERKRYSTNFIIFSGVTFLLLILSLIVPIRGALLLGKNFPTYPELSPKLGFELTKNAVKSSPLVGRGLGTELETFTRNKPVEYNNSDISDKVLLRYYADSFEILSTTGLLGLAVYLGVILIAARYAVFSVNDTEQKEKFFAGIVLIVIGLCSFFFSTGVLLGFIIFLLLALIELRDQNSETAISKPLAIVIAAVLAMSGILGMYGYGRIYLAEAKYKDALEELKKDNGEKTFDLLRGIKKINPYRSEYRRSLSQIELAIVSLVAEQGTLDEAAQKDVEILISDATNNIKENTERLNRFSTIEWENRGEIYLVLSSFISGTEDFVLDAYNKAIELDPNNPHLRERIGNIYLRFENKEDALKAFNDTIKLKPDLFSSRLSRAALLIDQGQKEEAKADLQYILDNTDSSENIYESAKTVMESL